MQSVLGLSLMITKSRALKLVRTTDCYVRYVRFEQLVMMELHLAEHQIRDGGGFRVSACHYH